MSKQEKNIELSKYFITRSSISPSLILINSFQIKQKRRRYEKDFNQRRGFRIRLSRRNM